MERDPRPDGSADPGIAQGRAAQSRLESASKLRIPRATYRLQLNRSFGFRDATAIVAYLGRLGVSHVYCSPFLKARAGTTHGYDIVDHDAFNPEIGTAEDFATFVATLAAHGMGLVADIVPNHMGVMGADNAYWMDVLENGPASTFAAFFDIDWNPPKPELAGKVLLPILGGHYGDVLERGEIQLSFDAARGTFRARYFGHELPIAPRCYPMLLGEGGAGLVPGLDPTHHGIAELGSLVTAFERLPARDVSDPGAVLERRRDSEIHKQRLANLVRKVPEIARHIGSIVSALNGVPGQPRSFDRLHDLLEAQAWRLADWHSASDDINYRRFFDINELAGLRCEDPRVFDATHGLILKLVADGSIEGLRVDHPDGLYDPQRYFERLQDCVAATNANSGGTTIWLVVEKILASHESLPETWPVHGTTGYEFMNLVNGIFIDPQGARRLDRFFRSQIGERREIDELVYVAKRLILKDLLAAELNVLAGMLARISEANRHTRDYTLNRLRQTLAEVVARLPVYRTYVRDVDSSDADRRIVDWAVAQAKKHTRTEDERIFDFVRSALLGEPVAGGGDAEAAEVLDFAMKFQQLTGPVMAKGYEDTLLYRHPALGSAAEVGSDLRRVGVSVRAFHSANRNRARRWPHSMLATSTHDNKRSEDVRLRLAALTELAPEFRDRIARWTRLNRARRRVIDGQPAPTPLDEYAIYQALVGTWHCDLVSAEQRAAYRDRIEAYATKASREAKLSTSWINPQAEYEQTLREFVHQILEPGEQNLFEQDLAPFAERVAKIGMLSSLSLTLLKLSSPGVPDIYQGTELIDDSLVDPDNRRPVDFAQRLRLLDALLPQPGDRARFARGLLSSLHSGQAKLYLIERVLGLRAREEALFRDGSYAPLRTTGVHADRVVAYARHWRGRTAIVVAPRLIGGLIAGPGDLPLGISTWGDTAIHLDARSLDARSRAPVYDDIAAGTRIEVGPGREPLAVANVLADFPAALLVTPPSTASGAGYRG